MLRTRHQPWLAAFREQPTTTTGRSRISTDPSVKLRIESRSIVEHRPELANREVASPPPPTTARKRPSTGVLTGVGACASGGSACYSVPVGSGGALASGR